MLPRPSGARRRASSRWVSAPASATRWSQRREIAMDVRCPRCAGSDIHKRTVVACRIVLTDDGEWLRETRTYGTTSADLLRLSDWLAAGARPPPSPYSR